MAVIYGPDGTSYVFSDQAKSWSDALREWAKSISEPAVVKAAEIVQPKPHIQLKEQAPALTLALGRAMAWTGDWDDRALWCLY